MRNTFVGGVMRVILPFVTPKTPENKVLPGLVKSVVLWLAIIVVVNVGVATFFPELPKEFWAPVFKLAGF